MAREPDLLGCIKLQYTSDVLEHKWRVSLKTILFLYE